MALCWSCSVLSFLELGVTVLCALHYGFADIALTELLDEKISFGFPLSIVKSAPGCESHQIF